MGHRGVRGATGSSKSKFLGGKGRREPEVGEWDASKEAIPKLLEQFSPQQQIHPFDSTAAAEALHGGENPDSAENFFRTQ